MRGVTWRCVLLVAALAAPVAARAQGAADGGRRTADGTGGEAPETGESGEGAGGETAPDAEAIAAARELFERGTRLMQNENWEMARVELGRSYERYPTRFPPASPPTAASGPRCGWKVVRRDVPRRPADCMPRQYAWFARRAAPGVLFLRVGSHFELMDGRARRFASLRRRRFRPRSRCVHETPRSRRPRLHRDARRPRRGGRTASTRPGRDARYEKSRRTLTQPRADGG